MTKKIVPDIVMNQSLVILPGDTTVREAARLMAQRRIGVVMVGSAMHLTGIFSERDMTARVVAKDLDPDVTTLDAVMTANPITIDPDDSPEDALEMMRARGFRHLPVVDGGKVIAMVSIRDLYNAIQDDLVKDLKDRDAFIYGGGYALGA